MTLTREQILAAPDIRREEVNVSEWGGSVFVKTMSGRERDAFEASCLTDGKFSVENIKAKLAARTVVDADGKRLFTDDDADLLGDSKSGAALGRIFAAAQKLNGLGKTDVEELAKNSGTGLSAGSPSA